MFVSNGRKITFREKILNSHIKKGRSKINLLLLFFRLKEKVG
nr:MAG TPA: hypothetical protein [Caudoviricetes sp.]